MKLRQLFFAAALTVAALPVAAQTWTIGGGLSKDDADIRTPDFIGEEDLLTHQIFGRFTSGPLMFEGRYINSSNNDEIDFFGGELEFERVSYEVAVGGRLGSNIDLFGGVRIEDVTLGDDHFLDDDEDIYSADHTLPFVGINAQSDPARFGVRGSGRYYFGEAETEFPFIAEEDLKGWTAELGFPIRFGDGSWMIEPGVAAEDFESDSGFYQIDSTKLFFNIGFTIR
jgi:hypothetical protein